MTELEKTPAAEAFVPLSIALDLVSAVGELGASLAAVIAVAHAHGSPTDKQKLVQAMDRAQKSLAHGDKALASITALTRG
jgi:thiamine monophosphate kinase